MNRATSTALALGLTLLMTAPAAAQWDDDYGPGALTYTSSTLVMKLSGDLDSVRPAIDDARVPGGDASLYLKSFSALGHYGPLSAYGPLGTLGPVGRNAWNVSYWISAIGDWDDWEARISGVLGPDGPLGEGGPVAEAQYYGDADPGRTLFATNDFAVHTRALGPWGILGPIGPLGALGPLGPLGPVGAFANDTDRDGRYLRDGAVIASTTIDFAEGGPERTYPLFESFDDEDRVRAEVQDTSFMVRGSINSRKAVDTYVVRSEVDQIVSILIVPEKELDDFDLAVAPTDGGAVIVANTGYETMDWVQMKVPAGQELQIGVRLYWTGHFLSSTYRLIVVGSGAALNATEVTGEHVRVWR